jgi:hypothetical protein
MVAAEAAHPKSCSQIVGIRRAHKCFKFGPGDDVLVDQQLNHTRKRAFQFIVLPRCRLELICELIILRLLCMLSTPHLHVVE